MHSNACINHLHSTCTSKVDYNVQARKLGVAEFTPGQPMWLKGITAFLALIGWSSVRAVLPFPYTVEFPSPSFPFPTRHLLEFHRFCCSVCFVYSLFSISLHRLIPLCMKTHRVLVVFPFQINCPPLINESYSFPNSVNFYMLLKSLIAITILAGNCPNLRMSKMSLSSVHACLQ